MNNDVNNITRNMKIFSKAALRRFVIWAFLSLGILLVMFMVTYKVVLRMLIEHGMNEQEYMIVQYVELEHRDMDLDSYPYIVDIGEYRVACIGEYDGDKRWVMLNPKYGSMFKMLPGAESKSDKLEVDNNIITDLSQIEQINKEVLERLRDGDVYDEFD